MQFSFWCCWKLSAFRRGQEKSFVNLDIRSLLFGPKCLAALLQSENVKKEKKSPDALIGLWNRWRDSHTCDINVPGYNDLPRYAQLKRGLNQQKYAENVKHDLWLEQKVGVGCFTVKAMNYDSRLWVSNHRSVTLCVTLGGLLETFESTLNLYVLITRS